jgi:hypothetical protein
MSRPAAVVHRFEKEEGGGCARGLTAETTVEFAAGVARWFLSGGVQTPARARSRTML